MTENWLEVAGFGGMYEVSDLGRIRSWRFRGGRRAVAPKVLQTHFRPRGGYVVATLWDGTQAQSLRLHRLVLNAFVGPLPPGCVSRHLNGDRLDNRLANLAYGTQAEKMWDRVDHGADPHARRTHCKNGHEYTTENTRIDVRANGRPRRVCRTCERAAGRAKYWRRKEAS